MQKRIGIGVVVLLLGLLASQGWAHGLGGFGGGFAGHFGGGHGGSFHGSFGHPGFHGFSHFGRFPHARFFGPQPHLGPFVPPSHAGHFAPGFFFGPSQQFGGFSQDFFFQDRSLFFGRPFVPVHPQVVVIRSPFFCYPDGLAFTDQALFFGVAQK
jgi:hypothetical protein